MSTDVQNTQQNASNDNVDLGAALQDAETKKTEKKKKRRSTKLPVPDFPEGKRQYDAALDIDPEKNSMPTERQFADPLHYWQTRERYAERVHQFAKQRATELSQQTIEQRLAKREAEKRQKAVQKAVNNDAVKKALADNPEAFVSGLSPEELARMVQQLNAMVAEKSVD